MSSFCVPPLELTMMERLHSQIINGICDALKIPSSTEVLSKRLKDYIRSKEQLQDLIAKIDQKGIKTPICLSKKRLMNLDELFEFISSSAINIADTPKFFLLH